jgi:hypothetical protein
MRTWDNKEVPGKGTKYCLVIDPEDGTNPIRTYGWSEREVLDKVAKTAEAAQQVINRQRSAPPAGAAVPASRVHPAPTLSVEDQMEATADLQNPAKAPEAIKKLLRGVGVDVDRMKREDDVRRVAQIAQEWASQHSDFPQDERNKRLLLDKASLMVGFVNIDAAALDNAYAELISMDMLFRDPEPIEQHPSTPPDAPDGSPATVERPRTATSYRRTALSAPGAPVVERKPKYTRAEIDAMNSKQLREKIDSEPGFKEWYDREFSSAAR